MPHSTGHDEAFREIQLNGKQLVFLFMAATVVSVVIFLCGVLVGRGVKPIVAETTSASASAETIPPSALPESVPSGTAPIVASPTTEPPPTPNELTYYDRLERNTPPVETLKAAPLETPKAAPLERVKPVPVEPKKRARVEPRKPALTRPLETAKSPATAATSADPSAPGYAVQVAALRGQHEADAMAKRLAGKGYPAYVMTPGEGAPAAVFRVRVGKFSNRRDADQVAARLEKEEQFKPWIVR